MVSIGTIFSIAIAGAVAAGGYALYRNYNKVGGALTRGVEKNISIPFGNYLDNLWKDTTTDIANAATHTVAEKVIDPIKNIPNPTTVFTNPFPFAHGYFDSPKAKTSPTITKPKSVPTLIPPTIKTVPTPNAPKLIPPTQSLAGWYYRNFAPGGRADQQIRLDAGSADALRSRGYDLTFLTTSQKLSDQAFTLFGKSKGYL